MAGPGISTKSTEKIPPGPTFWNPKEKIPEKHSQRHVWHFRGIFRVFFRVFWGYCSGVPGFRAGGVLFRYFSWKIPGPAISGQVSLADWGILKEKSDLYEYPVLFLLNSHSACKLVFKRQPANPLWIGVSSSHIGHG